jgi:hypothetical protein
MTLRLTEPTAAPAGGYPETRTLLESVGLTPKQAEAAARHWPPDAAREAIRTTRTANNPAAALAARVKGQPPAAPALQHGGVDGPGGDSTGSGGPMAPGPRWAAERLKTAERLRARYHRLPERYWELWHRLRQHFLGIFGDKCPNLTNHPSTMLDYGPAQDLARKWGYLEGDADDDTPPIAAS